MQIVIEKNTNIVKYAGEEYTLLSDKIEVRQSGALQYVIGDMNSSNATLAEVDSVPADYVGGKWSSREISKIGDEIKSGEITEINAEISEQLESERIAKLTTAQKEAEKSNLISALASRANAMRGELEIQGDAAALKKSQDWYKAEVEKVQARYQ